MSTASLGDLQFRINPTQVTWNYSVDVAVTPTIGGRVVQVLGATVGDMTIQGLYGHQRGKTHRESWVLAEDFYKRVVGMMVSQGKQPSFDQLSGKDSTPMHQPFRFFFSDGSPANRAAKKPVHHWDFQVYIKSIKDMDNPVGSIAHQSGKFSYGYALTLFIVADNTGKLATVAKNAYIERLSNGLGWQRTPYQGHMTVADLQEYLLRNSPDGTIHGLVLDQFENAGQGTLPGFGTATNPVPGGAGAIGSLGGTP